MDKIEKFKKKTQQLFKDGCLCSEALLKAAQECDIIDNDIDIKTLCKIASPITIDKSPHESLCGALTGGQLLIGCLIKRKDIHCSQANILKISKIFMECFQNKGHSVCCRATLPGFCETSEEKLIKCLKGIEDVIDLLNEHLLQDNIPE